MEDSTVFYACPACGHRLTCREYESVKRPVTLVPCPGCGECMLSTFIRVERACGGSKAGGNGTDSSRK